MSSCFLHASHAAVRCQPVRGALKDRPVFSAGRGRNAGPRRRARAGSPGAQSHGLVPGPLPSPAPATPGPLLGTRLHTEASRCLPDSGIGAVIVPVVSVEKRRHRKGQ